MKSQTYPCGAHPRPTHWTVRGVAALLGLALLYTLLNAVKPLHVDDAAYYEYARQAARHPLDPYGFQMFWYEQPEEATHILAPPLLPYWWAAAIRLFGERPFWWKCSLWPFSCLFVFALHALFRRFAGGLEMPLVVMTLLSPTFLPSLNLMLDVPALALSLAAVAVFMRASDRGSFMLAALAGLVAGLAAQTKYTGLLAPAAMLLYAGFGSLPSGLSAAVRFRKLLLWLAAAGTATALFVSWEIYVSWCYGSSHFLYHFNSQELGLVERVGSASLPLLALLGGVAPFGGVLGLVALRRRARTIAASVTLVALAFLLIAGLSATYVVPPLPVPLSLEQVVFTAAGAAVCVITGVVSGRLLRLGHPGWWRPDGWRRHWLDGFLAAWLGLELAGYLVLTPFPAVRRVMGLVVVGTLLIGRLASRTCRLRSRRRLIAGVVLANALLGLGFYGLDLHEAVARKRAVEEAAAAIRQQDSAARIWYVGHWGFQYYAERAGMQPVVPDASRLSPDDWLIVPDPNTEQQSIRVDAGRVRAYAAVEVARCLPLRTLWDFYCTATGAPVTHQDGPTIHVDVYRVTRPWVPRAPPGEE